MGNQLMYEVAYVAGLLEDIGRLRAALERIANLNKSKSRLDPAAIEAFAMTADIAREALEQQEQDGENDNGH